MKENPTKNVEQISKDLIPVTTKMKNTGAVGFFNVWIGIGIIIATFAIGGEAALYCNLQQIIFAAVVGTMLLGILFIFTGDIGVEHGVSFPTYVNATLGHKGTMIPNALRTIYGPIWFGIQSYFGATAINQILNVFFGFDNWVICFVLFVIVQVINTACGFKAMEKFANIAAPSIILIGIFIAFRLVAMANANGIQIWSTVYSGDGPTLTAGSLSAFMYVTILNMNYWADNACEVETWSRYAKTTKGEKNLFKRNKCAIPGYVIALPLASGFMVVLGALSTFVTGNYNPIEAINAVTNSPIVLTILLVMIVFAQWSTNVTANLMPSGLCLNALTRGKIPYWVGIVICGILGMVIRPWILVDHIGVFLTITGALWSTMYGMTIADFLLLRKRKLNVPELYKKSGGQFEYFHGFNPVGMISFAFGLVFCVIFPDYAFIAGVIASMILYYILAKFWIFKKYPQADYEDTGDTYRGVSVGRDWDYDEETATVVSSQ